MSTQALGGKHATGKSLTTAAIVAHLKAFGRALREVGPVNSNEAAAAHRAVLKKFYPGCAATLEVLHPRE